MTFVSNLNQGVLRLLKVILILFSELMVTLVTYYGKMKCHINQ